MACSNPKILPSLLAEDGTPFHPAGQWTVIRAILDVGAIRFELSISLHGLVNVTFKLRKAPFLRDVDLQECQNKVESPFSIIVTNGEYLLTTGELELGATK